MKQRLWRFARVFAKLERSLGLELVGPREHYSSPLREEGEVVGAQRIGRLGGARRHLVLFWGIAVDIVPRHSMGLPYMPPRRPIDPQNHPNVYRHIWYY